MKNLLIPVDFSAATEDQLSIGEQLARTFEAKIWILHSINEDPAIGVVGEVPMYVPVPDVPLPVRHPEEHKKLIELTVALLNRGIDAEEILTSGSISDGILSTADLYQVDLIIMGSHGHGALHDLFMGSITQSVLQKAHRPTLIIPTSRRFVGESRQWELQEAAAY